MALAAPLPALLCWGEKLARASDWARCSGSAFLAATAAVRAASWADKLGAAVGA